MCTDTEILARQMLKFHLKFLSANENTDHNVLIMLNRQALNKYSAGLNRNVDVSHYRNRLIAEYPGIREALAEEFNLYKLNQII